MRARLHRPEYGAITEPRPVVGLLFAREAMTVLWSDGSGIVFSEPAEAIAAITTDGLPPSWRLKVLDPEATGVGGMAVGYPELVADPASHLQAIRVGDPAARERCRAAALETQLAELHEIITDHVPADFGADIDACIRDEQWASALALIQAGLLVSNTMIVDQQTWQLIVAIAGRLGIGLDELGDIAPSSDLSSPA